METLYQKTEREMTQQGRVVKTLTFEQSAEIDDNFAKDYVFIIEEFNRKHASCRAYMHRLELISIER